MKATPTTPAWAVDLVVQVCRDYRRKTPTLQWYRSSRHNKSSGHAGWGRIHVTAGSDETDQRLVLLHELAHHITQKRQKQKTRYAFRSRGSRVFEGHSIRFWRLAFELYQRYGVELEYAYEREKSYKQKATQAYLEIKETP